MFGGFGSRFAKFGTGGGGRSIASAADLLQLFKRGPQALRVCRSGCGCDFFLDVDC